MFVASFGLETICRVHCLNVLFDKLTGLCDETLYFFKHEVVVCTCYGTIAMHDVVVCCWQSVILMCYMLEVFALLEELMVELNVV